MKLKRISDDEVLEWMFRNKKTSLLARDYATQAQLDADQKQVDELVGEIFRDVKAILFWELDLTKLQALAQKFGAK